MTRRWLSLILGLALVASSCTNNVAPLDDPGIGELSRTTIVYAADGSVLAEWFVDEDRVEVELAQVPADCINAVVAIEDERFFNHAGVDLRAVARALVRNLEAGEIEQGGSTITQQYVKNAILTPEVTLDRKVEEATLALRLEETLTKEEILERYLNTIYLGAGAYGLGSASQRYFNKPIEDLNLEECALLAGMIQTPNATQPYRNPVAALDRRRVVLQKMIDLGWITEEEAVTADAADLALAPARIPDEMRYPYFTEEVKQLLLDDPAIGRTATDRYNALFRGGLRIYTTLDPIAQEAAIAALAEVLPEDGPSGALAAVEPSTGYVRALVGGADFFDTDDPVAQFNLATQGQRQPGSSFKPFVLAAALEQGYSLNSVFSGGSSVSISTPSGPWVVENYAGSTYPALSLLEGTVFSVNVVYAQLVDAVGPAEVMNMAQAAGIQSSLDPFHSIALGAQEVNVLEMASAYSTFAAGGTHIDPILIRYVETADGVNLYQPVPIVTLAMEKYVADQVTAALTEVVKRGTARRAQIGRPLAGKTGTSQAHRDAWFVGYTRELSAAVWVGFPEGAISMEPPTTSITVVGGSYPAEIFNLFAQVALESTSFVALPSPDSDGIVNVLVDTSTGFLAGPFCPTEYLQEFPLPVEDAPTVVCPVHNPTGVSGVGATTVPNTIGMSLATATIELGENNFNTQVVWSENSSLPQGTVFNQSPSPGVEAQSGATIVLTLAGPEFGASTPSVLGRPFNVAKQLLEDNGIEVIMIIESEADAEAAFSRSGLVWKQTPAAGSDAPASVTVWVNP